MATRKFQVGESVFFKHKTHSWVLGTIEADTGKVYSCKANDVERKEVSAGEISEGVAEADIEPMQPDTLQDTPHDLLNLAILHDSTLLRCLYLRYMGDIIYTNIGAIVVALNPFNFTIPRYLDSEIPKYLSEGPVIQQNVPHSWAQAHNTFYEMMADRDNQCILISGESGAGKTEATKIVMKYLGRVSSLAGTVQEKESCLEVGVKLASCSPVLESFGNAKTVMNDNSSRFGKFVRVKFNEDGCLIGAHTTKYLLEKSRIVTANEGERVYHSFYLVARGKRSTEAFHMPDEKKYRSLNSGGCVHNPEFDTADDFKEVCDSMTGLGIADDAITSVWRVPAAILCLQSVTFTEYEDGCTINSESLAFVKQTCQILMIDNGLLKQELLQTTRVLPGNQTATNPNTVTKANDIRDAMSKGMYDGAFDWLVVKCNEKCDVDNPRSWIGLLDIFGFENFKFNSFEQVCINLTNETLQNHYNTYIFARDMDECRAEGIDVTAIVCPDNGPCMVLMTGQGGIIPLLDEQCNLGERGNDKAFYEQIVASHSTNPFFQVPKIARGDFIVHHYAASVSYDTRGWLDKNRDTLKDAIKTLVRASGDPIVAMVLPEPIPPELKTKERSVGGFFSNQLQELMKLINSTNPHWIRCIKPHPAKKPKMFYGMLAMNQLESSGVLGTVKIRKAGYPVRPSRDKFVMRYIVIGGGNSTEQEALITSILAAADLPIPAKAQIGKTKVFLKAEAYQHLEKARYAALEHKLAIVHAVAAGYLVRISMYDLYFEKHGEELREKQRLVEEHRRIMELAAEQERLEAQECERMAAEAAERARIAIIEAEKVRVDHAAITIQRLVRGVLARMPVFRACLNQHRAQFESEVEHALLRSRAEVFKIDTLRLANEKQYIRYLQDKSSVTNPEGARSVEDDRAAQKRRVRAREVGRVELRERLAIDELEMKERVHIVARRAALRRRMQKPESPQKEAVNDKMLRKKGKAVLAGAGMGPPASASAIERAAAADRHSEKLLAQYAARRSQVFDSTGSMQRQERDPLLDSPIGKRSAATSDITTVRGAHVQGPVSQSLSVSSSRQRASHIARCHHRPPLRRSICYSDVRSDAQRRGSVRPE